jgi:HK97 family phage portal protein
MEANGTYPEIKWLESRTSRWDELVSMAGSSGHYRITPDTAMRTSAVLACVRVLAETIAGLPLHLYRRGDDDKEKAKDLPLYRVLHSRPNSWQTKFEFVEQLVTHLCLYGNAYAYLNPGERAQVESLILLSPSGMEVKQDKKTYELTYAYREPGTSKQLIYRDDQIMHVRWLSVDGIVGTVPIELGKDAIALARALEQHGSRFWNNNAMPGVVLRTDQALPREVREQLREQWDSAHRGPSKAGRTAVMSHGLHADTLGASLESNQYAELRTQALLEICRVFNMPPHKVQELGRATWGNIEAENISFVQTTILPWLKRIEGAIGRDLLPESEEYFAEFTVEGLLRGDTMTRYNAYQIGISNGWLTADEIRKMENLGPMPEREDPPRPEPPPAPAPPPEDTEDDTPDESDDDNG